MATGVIELHWERQSHGALSIQLYEAHDGGQLSLMDAADFGPFDGPLDVAAWLTRALGKHRVSPAR